ncbi:hypothetical protein SAMN05192571_110120 [Pleomorphomonas diazotrophica]|nr:hypothetical protein SAMN05192571_110120 [Pleomorphomonas diazotrophica]
MLTAFGLLAMFEFLSGRPFLPSPAWVAYARGPAWIAGLASFACMLWVFRRYDKKNVFHFRDEVVEIGHLFGSLILLALYFGFGYMAAQKIPPMFDAILTGHRVEMTLTVEYTMPWESKYCGREVTFVELPLGASSICGVRKDLLDTFKPGSKIVVSGRGTAWGVFADRLRLVEDEE